jgi:predicted PurR-regulated permease PerM
MTAKDSSATDRAWQERVTQTVIRLSLLALLVFWCLRIMSPFVNPIIGGVVIAIALQTPYAKLTRVLGGRPRVAAAVMVTLALLIMIVPSIALGANLVKTATELSGEFAERQIVVPSPPEQVADWPLIGERLYNGWLGASQNLEAALMKLLPYLKDAGLWLVSTVGNVGLGLLLFVVAIVIAGALLPYGERAAALARRAASIVAGDRGPELVALAASSVHSVTRGVIGVALIQSLLAGLGMLIVGVPAVGIWSLLILMLAVMQLPPMIVILPVIFYVFSTSSTWVGILFTIWGVLIGVSDNVLKPLLMGKGSTIPMLVLFIGSLGGFIASGILGLFIGAIVLSLGYTLFMAWVRDSAPDGTDPATAATEIHS